MKPYGQSFDRDKIEGVIVKWVPDSIIVTSVHRGRVCYIPPSAISPTWKVEEDHITVKTLCEAYQGLFKKKTVVDKWTFSTNGVSIMGRHNIPVIGFGPGKEPQAHAPNEKTWKQHLVDCAAMYATIPLVWMHQLDKA